MWGFFVDISVYFAKLALYPVAFAFLRQPSTFRLTLISDIGLYPYQELLFRLYRNIRYWLKKANLEHP